MRSFAVIAFMLVLLASGSYCVFFARDIQARAVQQADAKGSSPAVKRFNSSKQYLYSIRSSGIIAYAMVALLLFALLQGK